MITELLDIILSRPVGTLTPHIEFKYKYKYDKSQRRGKMIKYGGLSESGMSGVFSKEHSKMNLMAAQLIYRVYFLSDLIPL